jgi:hypothetical protein
MLFEHGRISRNHLVSRAIPKNHDVLAIPMIHVVGFDRANPTNRWNRWNRRTHTIPMIRSIQWNRSNRVVDRLRLRLSSRQKQPPITQVRRQLDFPI